MAKGFKKTRLYKKMAKHGKRLAKDRLLSKRLPALYSEAASRPVDERKVVFVEGKLTKMPDAYTLLWKWLDLRYDFDLRYITLKQNTAKYRDYEQNCEGLVREIATAKYVFLNDASDVVSCVPLRPETKVVQLWHACGAFKKWGMSTADLKFGGSREALLRHPFYKNLDLVTVSSPEVEWAYREAMVLEDTPEVVRPLGVSRTDVFFDPSFVASARERVDMRYPDCRGKKVILYAPTFRGRVKTAKGPDQLDIAALRERLGGEYALLVKHHPFVKKPPEIPEGCESFAFQVGEKLPIDVLLAAADVCVSDYSSIVFEYSLFERPMAFFAPDLDDYDDWRGFYYNYGELTPGPVFQGNDELVDWLAHLDERFDPTEVRRFKQRFMSACDGFVTERIARDVFASSLERHLTRNTVEALVEENPQGKDISVIVPAYNSEQTLPRALNSLLKQTYSLDRVEVIVVDDCSSDGTWDVARRYERDYPDLIKVAQTPEQSGSPSKPRNIGLGLASGTFVFFMDADDWLGEQAILKMLDHAVEWESDVLAVKMRGRSGRAVPTAMFGEDDPACDIYRSKLMWTFAPLKLFRRSLVEHLGFPDFMPEDISFVLRALVEARTVSIASDYDYYNVAYAKGAGENISLSSWDDVESNLKAYEDLFGFIAARVPEEEQEHVLLRRLFRRDVLRTLMTIADTGGAQGREWHRRLVELVGSYYRPGAYLTTPIEKRVVLDAAFIGGYETLCAVTRCMKENADDPFGFLRYEILQPEEPDVPNVMCHAILAPNTAHDGKAFECEVGRGARAKALIERASWDADGVLSIRGSVAASHLFQAISQRTTATIMARDPETGAVRRWPCSVEWQGARTTVEDDYPARGVWSARIDAAEVMRADDSDDVEGVGADAAAVGAMADGADDDGDDVNGEDGAIDAKGASASTSAAPIDNSVDGGVAAAAAVTAAAADSAVPAEAASPAVSTASENIWYLYLMLETEGMSKQTRLRYRVISSEYPWGSLATAVEEFPDRQLLLRGSRAGNFSLVDRPAPQKRV